MKKLLLLHFFIMLGLFLQAQENCSNGIDDDSDGKIDLNDLDCVCNQNTMGANLITNGSFENISSCPDQSTIKDFEKAVGWHAGTASGTPDLYNACNTSNMQTFPTNIPDGFTFAGIINLPTVKEYVAQCLTNPIQQGKTYTFSFSMIDGQDYRSGPEPACSNMANKPGFTYTLYGKTACSNLPEGTFHFPPNACPLTEPGLTGWTILGSITYTPNNTTWQKLTITFTSTVDINAIMFGPDCNYPAFSNPNFCFSYMFIDDLSLHEKAITITTSGKLCTDDLILNASSANPGGTWQWYKNGVALIGKTSSSLNISGNGYTTGDYTVVYTQGNSCASNSYKIDNCIVVCKETNGQYTASKGNGMYSWERWGTIQDCSGCTDVPGVPHCTWPAGCAKNIPGWVNFANGTTITPGNTYPIRVKDGNGLELIINAANEIQSCQTCTFVPTFTSDKVTGCQELTVTFTNTTVGYGLSNCQWDFGDGNTSSICNPSHSYTAVGNYDVTLKITDANGCFKTITKTALIEVTDCNPDCTFKIDLGPDITVCSGAYPVSIQGPTGMNTYTWTGTGISNGNSFSATTKGKIFLKVDSVGCFFTDSLMIKEMVCNCVASSVKIIESEGGLCGNDLMLITTTNDVNHTYQWYKNNSLLIGEDKAILNVSAKNYGDGVYLVKVTDILSGTCSKDSVMINPEKMPVFNLGNDTTICSGNNISLEDPAVDASLYTFKWQDNSTASVFTADKTGNYWLEITDAKGCKAKDTINITVQSINVSLGEDITMCPGKDTLLNPVVTANPTGNYIYLWHNNSSNTTFLANAIGTYWTELRINNCNHRDSVDIDFYPLLNFDVHDTVLCENQSGTFFVPSPFTIDKWYNGSQQNSIQINNAGNYSLQVKDNNQCAYSDNFSLSFVKAATLSIPNPLLCENDSVLIKIPTPFIVDQWWDQSTLQSKYIYKPGNYNLSVIDTNVQCPTTSSFSIKGVADPKVFLGSDTSVCFDQGELIMLFDRSITSNEGQYIWQNSSNDKYYLANEKGNYWLLETNYCGKAIDSVDIDSLICEYSLYIPNSFTPGSDGKNDVFRPYGEGITYKSMSIYNRWGELIYTTTDIAAGWNGTHQLTGELAQIDVYVYVLEAATTYKNKKLYRRGRVTLLQ